MKLTEEMIKKLPLITEEELREIEKDEKIDVVEETVNHLKKRFEIIDEMYDRYENILTEEEIRYRINNEFKKLNI